ncbi:DUF3833 domain-containing protein [Caenispirillum salinarum]|nr:DUF3833 domain-containing protein [Caenispirillum salinarum]
MVRVMRIEDFRNQTPRFAPEDYFAGRTRAWGLFLDRFGGLRRQFVVDIAGIWDPGLRHLILDESFRYDDGSTETRTWTLRRHDGGRYEGWAGDVIGAAHGRCLGNAFHWRYALAVPMGGRTVKLAFDDWMFLQPGGVLLNRATVSKWGLDVGTVSIAYSKTAEGDAEIAAASGVTAAPAQGPVADSLRTRRSAAE